MSNMKVKTIRTLLGVTVSALAIAAGANAQTLVLPGGFNTVTMTPDSGNTGTLVTFNSNPTTTYSTIEIGNGIKAEVVSNWAAANWAVGDNTALVMQTLTLPTNQLSNWSGLSTCANGSLAYNSTSCLNHAPTIQVDKGGTLILGGVQTNASMTNPWGFESDVHADGDVLIEDAGSPSWAGKHLGAQIVGTNYFGGNLTLAPNALATFGLSWAAAQTEFGPNTNIILGDASVMDLWLPGAGSATMGGNLQGTGTLQLDAGTLYINGQNTAATPFHGNLNARPGSTVVIGDASHPGAIVGDPGNVHNYTLTLAGTMSGGATLRGFGTIAGNLVNTSSVVQPGYGSTLGTLTVQGNYSQDGIGTLKVQVTPDGTSSLHVLGNAAINGTLNIAIAPGAYKTQVYNIIQVDGTMTGDFSSIVPDSVQGAIAAVTRTDHGYAVVTQVVQGASATAPVVVGHLADANRLNNYYLVGALYDQIALDTARNSTEIGHNKYAWVEGFGHLSSVSRNDVGYHTDTEGIRGGVEYRNEANATIGLAASWSTENLKAKGPSTAEIDTWHVAAYGGYDVQYVRLDGVLFYDTYDTTTKRDFGTDGVAETAPGGYSYGASIQASKSVLNDLLTPYIRGIFSRQHVDAAVETGAPLLNLRYLADNANTFVADLGFRINPLRNYPDSKTKLLVTVAIEHDFSPLGETVNGTFPVANGQSWFYYWRGDSENTALVGVDVARQLTDKLEVSGRVNGRVSLYQTSGEVALHAAYKF